MEKETGFTLVEVVLTVALILVVSTGAILNIPPMLKAYKDRQANAVLAGSIREAQVRAMEESRPWRVAFGGGSEVLLSRGSNAASVSDCEPFNPLWETVRTEQMPTGVNIEASGMSRSCISFTSSGGPAWSNPTIDTDLSTPSHTHNEVVIIDGTILQSPPNSVITNEPRVTVWSGLPGMTATIRVNVGELRYFDKMGIGVNRCTTCLATPYYYPHTIRVRGSASTNPGAGDWTFDYTTPGPTGSGNWSRQTVLIPVAGTYQSFEITLTTTGRYIVVDEIDMGELVFPIKGASRNWKLIVTPITGRVRIEQL